MQKNKDDTVFDIDTPVAPTPSTDDGVDGDKVSEPAYTLEPKDYTETGAEDIIEVELEEETPAKKRSTPFIKWVALTVMAAAALTLGIYMMLRNDGQRTIPVDPDQAIASDVADAAVDKVDIDRFGPVSDYAYGQAIFAATGVRY